MGDQLLTDRAVAHVLSISRASVWRLVRLGRLPAPVKIGERATRWKASDIDAFIASASGEAA